MSKKSYSAQEAVRVLGEALAKKQADLTKSVKKFDAQETLEELRKALHPQIEEFKTKLAGLRKAEGLPAIEEPMAKMVTPDEAAKYRTVHAGTPAQHPCPHCGGQLQPSGEGSTLCTGCRTSYPNVGSIVDYHGHDGIYRTTYASMDPKTGEVQRQEQKLPLPMGKAEPHPTKLCGNAGCTTTVDKDREYCTPHTKGAMKKDESHPTKLCGNHGCHTTVDKDREYCSAHQKKPIQLTPDKIVVAHDDHEKSESDKYNYYLVHSKTGKIHGGNEYKEDAHEAHGEHPELHKFEPLSKPPVSQAQRGAMAAAAHGNSTLGIPKKVGKEFIDADKGGKLPETKKTEGVSNLDSPKDSPKNGSGGQIKGNPLKKDLLPSAKPTTVTPGKPTMASKPPKMGASAGASAMKPPAPPAAPGMKGSHMGVDTQKAEIPGAAPGPFTQAHQGAQDFRQGMALGANPLTAILATGAAAEQAHNQKPDIMSHLRSIAKPAVAKPPMAKNDEGVGDNMTMNEGGAGMAMAEKGKPMVKASGVLPDGSGFMTGTVGKKDLKKAMPHPGFNATGMKTAMSMDPNAKPPAAVVTPALKPMGAPEIRAKVAGHAQRAAQFKASMPAAGATGHAFKPTGGTVPAPAAPAAPAAVSHSPQDFVPKSNFAGRKDALALSEKGQD